jgi:hypothetical protein
VLVKSQSRRTMEAWFPLRWRFRGRSWTGKIYFVEVTLPDIGEGVPPVKINFSCILIEFCTSQLPISQDYGCVIPPKMMILRWYLDWQHFFCQGHFARHCGRCSPCQDLFLMHTHWVFVLVKLQYCFSTIKILVFHQISTDFQLKNMKLAFDPSKHSWDTLTDVSRRLVECWVNGVLIAYSGH